MSSIASFSSLIAAAMRVEADRAAAELVDDRPQQLAIDFVEPVLVDLEQLQRRVRDLERDRAVGAHLRVVADAPQQPVGDARRAARPPRDLGARPRRRSARSRIRAERRTISSRSRRRVELEPVRRCRSAPAAARSAARSRVVAPISVNCSSGTFTDPRARALADHDVELVVLERRIEDLLDRRRHPVDLVDEQHLARRRGW